MSCGQDESLVIMRRFFNNYPRILYFNTVIFIIFVKTLLDSFTPINIYIQFLFDLTFTASMYDSKELVLNEM